MSVDFIFWDITACSPLKVKRRFGRTWRCIAENRILHTAGLYVFFYTHNKANWRNRLSLRLIPFVQSPYWNVHEHLMEPWLRRAIVINGTRSGKFPIRNGYIHLQFYFHTNKPVMKRSMFWDKTPCGPFKVNRIFGATCRFHFQSRKINWAQKPAW
jgi:hypothetical protein